MNPLFKQIAACPRCHSALEWRAETCSCLGCGRRYPLRDGVPLMSLNAAGEPSEQLSMPAPHPRQDRSWQQYLSRATRVPGFSYKTRQSRQRLPRFVAGQGAQAVILNLGSGSTSFGPRVVNLDIGPFPNVDVVAGSEALPVGSACLDAVITQGVLEHVPDLPATLAEIDRVLRPGGQVYHEVPFIQGYHGSPGDFRRFTTEGIRELAAGYAILEQGVAVGPSSAVGWLLSEWLALLFSFGSDRLHRAGRRLFGWLLSPVKFADAWLERRPRAELVACALYIVARKPDQPGTGLGTSFPMPS